MQTIGNLSATGAAFFWACAVIMFKKSGETLPPTTLNLFKCVVTLVLLTPTLWLAGIPLFPARPVSEWVLFAVSGLLGITVADNLFFMALGRLGAGLWAVVDCLYLPAVILLSAIFLNESIGLKGVAGALLVVTAIIAGTYSGPALVGSRRDLAWGFFYGGAAVTLMAASIILIKPLLETTGVLWASFVRLAAGVSGLFVMAAIHPQRRQMLSVFLPSRSWRWAVPAAVVGNYLAMLAWLAGFKYTLVSVAAILNQLATIFTFLLAAAFLKEPITQPRLLAIALALSGALLATTAM
jgi:drug/metabolite transporter (DMT)-like permease